MAQTSSKMLPLGTEVKDFKLYNTVTNCEETLYSKVKDRPFVIMFICNHCPFVIHLHEGLQNIYKDYQESIDFVAISSNNVADYPSDRPELMNHLFKDLGLDFPYFYDKEQTVAKLLDAACTPDFYLFDSNRKLVYRGRFDASRPGNDILVTGRDLRNSFDLTLEGKFSSKNKQLPSLGCNIKWK